MKVKSKVVRTCHLEEKVDNAYLYFGAAMAVLGILLAGIAVIRGMFVR